MFQESQSSALWFQPVWSPSAVISLKLHPPLHITLEEPGPGPRLHYCFFLHPLTRLITNCLNQPFGTQGRSRTLKPSSYKQETEDSERLLYPGGPNSVLLGFNSNGHWTQKESPLNILRSREKQNLFKWQSSLWEQRWGVERELAGQEWQGEAGMRGCSRMPMSV